MDNLVWFLVVSGAIYVLLEGIKKLRWFKSSKFFNDLLPIIPQVLGTIAGVLVGPTIVEGMSFSAAATAGLLAGGLSASSYSVIKKLLEKKAERVALGKESEE